MVHFDVLGTDTGKFTTEEVRPRSKPSKATSRTIAFFPGQYQEPPNLAPGLCSLDLAHEVPARANITVDSITASSFKINLETWGNSKLYSASATWMEHKGTARECFSGHFDTQELMQGSGGFKFTKKGARSENSKEIRFPHAFKRDCEVVCWLSRLDMAGGETNYRLRAYATNMTPHGFTAHIDTWGDSVLNGAAMTWIAFPKNKRLVQSGSFGTGDVRSWSNPKPKNSTRVNFSQNAFQRKPTVLVALNMLDMGGNSDLRIRVHADEVTEQGFQWHLDTWDDSTLYAAGASWIALG